MTPALSHEPIVRVNTPGEVVLTPGGQAHARIELVVADGYHVQANPVSQAFLVPLRLGFRSRQRIRPGQPSYPRGVPYRLEGDDKDLMTYGGVVGIDVSIAAEEAAVPGRYTLRGVLQYQGCDRRFCLFPATEEVRLSVRVLPADA